MPTWASPASPASSGSASPPSPGWWSCWSLSTLIWVPVGVKIGMSPKLSRYAQPVVQVLASFPAILLFPFATLIFIDLGIPLDYGAIVLMMLGAQWYILFNVIAGASCHPQRPARDDGHHAPDPAPTLAPGHPAGHLPRLRHRGDHRRRRGAGTHPSWPSW